MVTARGGILGAEMQQAATPVQVSPLCASGRIRTCGTWYRKPVLYPLSYGGPHRPGGQCAVKTTRRSTRS